MKADRRSQQELIALATGGLLVKEVRADVHECEVFLAELHLRRRVPLSDEELAVIREMAKIVRNRADFGFNPHPVKPDCKCGNCVAKV